MRAAVDTLSALCCPLAYDTEVGHFKLPVVTLYVRNQFVSYLVRSWDLPNNPEFTYTD